MAKKKEVDFIKINKQYEIIRKAIEKIKKLHGDSDTIHVSPTDYDVVLIKRKWTEDFIDEDTGQIVSCERKMLHIVKAELPKGALEVY